MKDKGIGASVIVIVIVAVAALVGGYMVMSEDGDDSSTTDENEGGTIGGGTGGGYEVVSSFDSPGGLQMGLAWDGTHLWNADDTTDKIYKLSVK